MNTLNFNHKIQGVEVTNDELIQFVPEDLSLVKKKMNGGSWKLIVADDDEEVHAVTALALSDFNFKNKPLTILNSYSAKETQKLIDDNPDTAVIFLDVVMENHDSGLQLVKYIRETVGNNLIRIILRTGQPGYAPELEVITNFDINNYKEKTELTSSKLITTLISSLRNYDDLAQIEENRQILELMASASARMHGLSSSTPGHMTIIETLKEIMKSFTENGEYNISMFDGIILGNELIIKYSTGAYKDMHGEQPLKELIPHSLYQNFKSDNFTDNIFFLKNSCTILLKSTRGMHRIIHLQNIPELSEMKKSILKSFALNISTLYNNEELLETQKKIEEEIRSTLEEKVVLVKEIHHRVKNNLQIISSLLHIQSSGTNDEKLISFMKESEYRIQSMSLVHEKLYQSDLMATIDFEEYIRTLAERLIYNYGVYENIKLKLLIDPLMLSINTAIPCGLIINEMLTNSIKYAFPENKKGTISIVLNVINGLVRLNIKDNGIGLPLDFDIKQCDTLGFKLIRILTEQINGKIEIISEKGTSCALSFYETEEREE